MAKLRGHRHFPDRFENAPEIRLRGKAHSSIRVQEGTPTGAICATSCWCRFSAISTASNWRPAGSGSNSTPKSGTFAVWAYDVHKLPICPLHYERILGSEHPALERIGDLFAGLPAWRPQVERRAGELKAALATLAREHDDVREAIEAAVARLNGREGDFESWQALHALIQDQHWRIAHFRVAADDINYRRFFNINDLAGLRMELPDVFDHVHRLVFRLLEDGTLSGLRIDHIDGLFDPRAICVGCARRRRGAISISSSRRSWRGTRACARTGRCRAPPAMNSPRWCSGFLVDPAGEEALTRIYREFTGDTAPSRRSCASRSCASWNTRWLAS